MSKVTGMIATLIENVAKEDPTLADTLRLINQELNRIAIEVDPPPLVRTRVPGGSRERPLNIETFNYSFTGTAIILTWEAPQEGFLMYEIRTNSSSFSDGDIVTTTTALSVILDPNDEIGVGGKLGAVGARFFTIMATDSIGQISREENVIEVIIPALGIISITPSVINNQVILNWTVPSSTFNISHYEIYKDASLIADNVSGTFYVIQEGLGGTYVYGVKAVDIAGNESNLATITLDVNGPADFEIQDSQTSDLSGTIVNGVVESGVLYVGIDLVTTYEDHFIDNTWDDPQEQIDDGFPLWIQPTEINSSYEETFDFGSIFANTIVNLSYLFNTIVGSFTFAIDAKVSDDDIIYSSSFTTPSFFAPSVRYVKVKLTFTATDNTALLAFSNFICTLLVKREIDSGEAEVFAADGAGTVVEFNKAFRIVESITVTPLETAVRSWVYDFDHTTQDPTEFLVLLWNSAGSRVDGTISWKARGIF